MEFLETLYVFRTQSVGACAYYQKISIQLFFWEFNSALGT